MQSNSNRARHSYYHTDSDEIAALKRRLTIHRRNLYELEEQKAKYGLDVPVHIINEIAEQKEAIAQIESRLAELSVSVPQVDHGATKPDIWLPSDESLRHVRVIEQLTASKQAEQLPSKLKKIWLPRVWWVPIVVALIGLIGVIITSRGGVTPAPSDTSFGYQVRVQAKDTGEYIPNSKVTIEVSGQAPLDDITDSNGFVRIFVSSSHAGKPGILIVEAAGYKRYTQNIDLIVGTLPDVVQLEPVP